MVGPVVYLDSSAVIKRYVREPGSDVVRDAYVKARSGDIKISFSVWNVGEVLGALDRARRLGRLSEESFRKARKAFLLETKEMMRHGTLIIVPIRMKILKTSWNLVEKHHIYAADALQIASAKHVNAKKFMTADKHLHTIAQKEKLNSTLLQ